MKTVILSTHLQKQQFIQLYVEMGDFHDLARGTGNVQLQMELDGLSALMLLFVKNTEYRFYAERE